MGLVWTGLTVAFEFLAGHHVFGNSWARLPGDYDVLRGRVRIAVLLTLLLGPVTIGRIRERR